MSLDLILLFTLVSSRRKNKIKMVFRLYEVDSKTEKCTGRKRDYPSEEHFIKYGLETYERYNREFYYANRPTGTKAKLCFLNDNNKWEEVDKEYLNKLIKQ